MPAFRSHKTAVSDQPWDGPANKTRVRSGEKRVYYGRIFAGYDSEGNEGAKETYHFIHHEVAEDGTPGPANLTACSSGIGTLNGGRGGTTIPAADRPGYHAHLASHLKDGKKEVPPLKSQVVTSYPLLAASFFGKCWAILPSKLDEMLVMAEALLEGKKIDWPEAAVGNSGARAQEEPYQVQDGVALIRVYGVLDKRMNMFADMSGGTSYELLDSQIARALSDPQVMAVLLDVDSPGGSVDGVKTVADHILAARGSKPIVAFANGQMTSAAYWIGSAADGVVAPMTAMVGSLGTRMMHRDLSGQDAQKGIKRTAIYSGKYKNVGSDAAPLSPEDQAVLQEMSDYFYQLFLEDVARNRGQDMATVHKEMGDGRIFIGQQAKDAGLIDQIGTIDDALALAKNMASEAGQGGQSMDRKTLESQHPELFAEVKALGVEEAMAKGKTAGAEAGVAAERARVVEVLEAVKCQGILMQIIQGGSDSKDALKLILANYDQVKAEALAAMEAAAPPAVGTVKPEIDSHTDPRRDAPIETRAKADWDNDPALREQYMDRFEAYLAYKRGEEAGTVKILGKK
jgi:signal peptide peptidase SppA